MKKSKKVLLSAAIAAAIMGSVSVPEIYANDLTADNVNATTGNFSQLNVGGKAQFNDEVSIDKDLNVSGHVEANTINATGAISSTQINGTTVNADKVDTNKLTVGNIDNVEQAITDNKTAADKAQATADGAQKDATKANYKADAALKVTGNGVLYNHATNLTDGVNQNKLAADKAQAAADKAQKTADANTDSINALDGRVTTNESNIAKIQQLLQMKRMIVLLLIRY